MRNINTGEFEFGGVTHYWVEVDRDVIIESPNHKTITVAKRGEAGTDYIKVQGKAKELMPVATEVRDRLLKVGVDGFLARSDIVAR